MSIIQIHIYFQFRKSGNTSMNRSNEKKSHSLPDKNAQDKPHPTKTDTGPDKARDQDNKSSGVYI